jgi:hypothetical protein
MEQQGKVVGTFRQKARRFWHLQEAPKPAKERRTHTLPDSVLDFAITGLMLMLNGWALYRTRILTTDP